MTQLFSGLTSQLLGKASLQQLMSNYTLQYNPSIGMTLYDQ